LEILCFKKNIALVIFGKIPHGLKPCDLEKGIIISHRFYFLIAQAFFFFDENILLNFYSVLFKKNFTNVLITGFHKKSKECEL